MATELYKCTTCKAEVLPMREGRNVIVRGRRVLLQCGHTASPGAIRIKLAPADPELAEDLWGDRTGGK